MPRELTAGRDGARSRSSSWPPRGPPQRCGFDLIELHCAHGYLLSSFISPVTNQRADGYGGSLAGRLRYPLEVFAAMREVWPADKPMTVRISATDWCPGGITGEDAVEIARAFPAAGADAIDVSTGQVTPDETPAFGRSYQTPFADAIRNQAGIATIAVGVISSYDDVNSIILAGRADLCALGRAHLYDPNWTLHAAAEQGYDGPAAAWPDPWRAGSRPPQTGRSDGPRPRLQLIRTASRAPGTPGGGPAPATAQACAGPTSHRTATRSGGDQMALERVNPPSLPRPSGFSHAVVAAGGRTGLPGRPDRASAPTARSWATRSPRSSSGRWPTCWRRCARPGGSPEHLASLTIYAVDLDDYRAQGREIGQAWRRLAGRDYPAMAGSGSAGCGTRRRWSRSRATRSSLTAGGPAGDRPHVGAGRIGQPLAQRGERRVRAQAVPVGRQQFGGQARDRGTAAAARR